MFVSFILKQGILICKTTPKTDITVNQKVIPIYPEKSHLPMSNLCLKPNMYP